MRLKSPPRTIVINTAADPRRTFKANPRRIRGLADTTPRRTLVRQKWRTPTFFHDQKVRRSAAYLSRIRSGSAADFWVRGGLRRSPQRIHLSPRKLSTWRIRHRSATGPPKSASDPRRYRGGLESAHLIASFLTLTPERKVQSTCAWSHFVGLIEPQILMGLGTLPHASLILYCPKTSKFWMVSIKLLLM